MLERLLAMTLLICLASAPAQARSRVYLPPLAGRPSPPGDYERALRFGGTTRYYEVHVPPGAPARAKLPVVMNFHGGMGNADAARRSSHLDAKSDREKFLAVYPQGLGAFPRRFLTWNAGKCCGRAQREGSDDVGFVRAILDDLPAFVPVDERRIYATGFSNGGMMSHRLGCELSERIAAIAPVGGTLGLTSCKPARPVPVMHIHGTADENCPYHGGTGAHSLSGTDFTSVADTVKAWRSANRAVATSETSKRGAVTTARWAPGPGGAEVVLVTIQGQGHVWPGGEGILPERMIGRDVGALKATDLIWEFFEKHSLETR